MRLAAIGLVAGLAGVAAAQVPAGNQGPIHVPVLRENFPDPHIITVGKHFLAYATNAGDINVPMAVSTDLVTWKRVKGENGKPHDALPNLPTWAKEGFTWAPEVMEVGGRYLLYFTASNIKLDTQCIGVAESADPLGPFVSTAPVPLVCQPALGGTIDAHPFRDADGQLYMYYKNDGNNPRVLKPSQIWVQKMSADGRRVEGEAKALLRNDKHWEWRVVEAPSMVRHDGRYTMFFSANHFGWEADQRLSNYGTGYATCAGPMGPCTDAAENPWLRSYNTRTAGCLSGPGHPTVFETGGRRFMAFHAWAANAGCRKTKDERHMYIAPLLFEGGKPALARSLRPVVPKK